MGPPASDKAECQPLLGAAAPATHPVKSEKRHVQAINVADEDLDEPNTPIPKILFLLFFLCGMTVFSRTEAFLLQTQFYAMCLEYGRNFYVTASAVLFLPGVLLQFIQSKYDHVFDQRFSAYRANFIRILISTCVCLLAILLYLLLGQQNREMLKSAPLLFSMLVLVGLTGGITFGSFTQILSMFPEKIHPFFFIGTMCPFIIFAPVNAGIGDICCAINATDISHTCVPSKPENVPMHKMGWWFSEDKFWTFYAVGLAMTLGSFIAFAVIANHPYTRALFRRKDSETTKSKASEKDTDDAALSARSSLVMLKKIWMPVTTQSLSTFVSLVVSSQYVVIYCQELNLPTKLQYEYYIGNSVGMCLTLLKAVRELDPRILLLIAVFRLVFVPLILLDTQQEYVLKNDWAVIGLNGICCILGGMTYSLSFQAATSMFPNSQLRTQAASLMNISYYMSMAVSIGITFLINSLLTVTAMSPKHSVGH